MYIGEYVIVSQIINFAYALFSIISEPIYLLFSTLDRSDSRE
jgi:hypothetical protein